MPRTVVPQCLVLHSTGSGQSGPARPEALATPLRYQSVTAQRGCHVTRFGDTRAVMTWNPRGSQGTASRAMWSGKEMTLLSPPPRTTVRIRHRGHGSSNRVYPDETASASLLDSPPRHYSRRIHGRRDAVLKPTPGLTALYAGRHIRKGPAPRVLRTSVGTVSRTRRVHGIHHIIVPRPIHVGLRGVPMATNEVRSTGICT